MPRPISELVVARNTIATACREISKKPENIGKDSSQWSGEDQQAFDRGMAEYNVIDREYQEARASQRSGDRSKFLETLDAFDRQPQPPATDPSKQIDRNAKQAGSVYTWKPKLHLPNNPVTRNMRSRGKVNASVEYDVMFNKYITGAASINEFYNAGMTAEDETGNAYTVLPEKLMSGIIRTVDDAVFIQGMSRVFIVGGARSLGFRKRTSKASTARKGSELGDITAALESGLAFGKRALTPHYYIAAAQMSSELLRSTSEDPEALYMQEIGININEFIENEYLYGDGNEGCLGLMVPGAEGISTARDLAVQTGEATTISAQFGFTTLARIYTSLKTRYQSNSAWMFNRSFLTQLMTMTNPAGQLIWQLSARDGEPDRLLGRPLVISEWMPTATGAGKYFCLFGDFQQYYIAWDAAEMQTRRLVEIAARQNMVEFHFRWKMDGMPILEEAFTRGAFGS